MLGLSRLFNAFSRLAGAIESLSETAEQANAGLRQRLALDGTMPAVPALGHTPADDALAEGEDATQPVAPSRRGNGRAKSAT